MTIPVIFHLYLLIIDAGYIAGVSILSIALGAAVLALIGLIIYAIVIRKDDGIVKDGRANPNRSHENNGKRSKAYDQENHAPFSTENHKH
jgi:hypothetical protein